MKSFITTIDREAINTLQSTLGSEILNELLPIYFNDNKEKVNKIESLLAEKNIEQIA